LRCQRRDELLYAGEHTQAGWKANVVETEFQVQSSRFKDGERACTPLTDGACSLYRECIT
jgi:hypothetical protein